MEEDNNKQQQAEQSGADGLWPFAAAGNPSVYVRRKQEIGGGRPMDGGNGCVCVCVFGGCCCVYVAQRPICAMKTKGAVAIAAAGGGSKQWEQSGRRLEKKCEKRELGPTTNDDDGGGRRRTMAAAADER